MFRTTPKTTDKKEIFFLYENFSSLSPFLVLCEAKQAEREEKKFFLRTTSHKKRKKERKIIINIKIKQITKIFSLMGDKTREVGNGNSKNEGKKKVARKSFLSSSLCLCLFYPEWIITNKRQNEEKENISQVDSVRIHPNDVTRNKYLSHHCYLFAIQKNCWFRNKLFISSLFFTIF